MSADISDLRLAVQEARSRLALRDRERHELAARVKSKEEELEAARRPRAVVGHPFRESQRSQEQREADLLAQLRELCEQCEQAESALAVAGQELRRLEAKLTDERAPDGPCTRCAGTEFQIARAYFEHQNGPHAHHFDVVVCKSCKKSEFFLVDPDGSWMKAYGVATVSVGKAEPKPTG
jgi:seryl-tRNA synthetase